MKFKPHTLLKGIVWEMTGVIMLATGIWVTTGNLYATSAIGITYPIVRALLWYPFERMWKRIRRRKYGVDTPNVKINITARDNATRAIDIASKRIAECCSLPASQIAGFIRSAIDTAAVSNSVVDIEAVARNKLEQVIGFSVSKELMYLAQTNPMTAQRIREELEIRIRTGGEPKERFVQRFNDITGIESIPMRRATENDGPPPLPPVCPPGPRKHTSGRDGIRNNK